MVKATRYYCDGPLLSTCPHVRLVDYDQVVHANKVQAEEIGELRARLAKADGAINRLEGRLYTVAEESGRMREALLSLLPGFVIELRYAGEDDDKDALQSRIDTVRGALPAAGSAQPATEPAKQGDIATTGESAP